mmetsp:Transcript_23756/g.66590  ORF Transcript_23756/g.66590 Transcript_23756/m.66590 type:complete len:640 (+) Transcript_23756:316-2235(+)
MEEARKDVLRALHELRLGQMAARGHAPDPPDCSDQRRPVPRAKGLQAQGNFGRPRVLLPGSCGQKLRERLEAPGRVHAVIHDRLEAGIRGDLHELARVVQRPEHDRRDHFDVRPEQAGLVRGELLQHVQRRLVGLEPVPAQSVHHDHHRLGEVPAPRPLRPVRLGQHAQFLQRFQHPLGGAAGCQAQRVLQALFDGGHLLLAGLEHGPGPRLVQFPPPGHCAEARGRLALAVPLPRRSPHLLVAEGLQGAPAAFGPRDLDRHDVPDGVVRVRRLGPGVRRREGVPGALREALLDERVRPDPQIRGAAPSLRLLPRGRRVLRRAPGQRGAQPPLPGVQGELRIQAGDFRAQGLPQRHLLLRGSRHDVRQHRGSIHALVHASQSGSRDAAQVGAAAVLSEGRDALHPSLQRARHGRGLSVAEVPHGKLQHGLEALHPPLGGQGARQGGEQGVCPVALPRCCEDARRHAPQALHPVHHPREQQREQPLHVGLQRGPARPDAGAEALQGGLCHPVVVVPERVVEQRREGVHIRGHLGEGSLLLAWQHVAHVALEGFEGLDPGVPAVALLCLPSELEHVAQRHLRGGSVLGCGRRALFLLGARLPQRPVGHLPALDLGADGAARPRPLRFLGLPFRRRWSLGAL